jgi:hypothetical protein
MDNYEFINGKKYKKCSDNKIRNPITLRCINNNYEFINGKKYKKCSDNKIRNPITMRCINNKNPIKIPTKIPNSTSNTNFIYDRITYSNILLQHFKLKNNKNYCIKLYKIDNNNNPIFRIGSNIILKNRIGSPSDYGIIYLSSFRHSDGKIFKFAIKMFLHENKHLDKEIKITERISKLVSNQISPHFILVYKILRCNNFNFYNIHNSSTSSSINDKSLQKFKNKSDFFNLYPTMFKNNINHDFHIIICELANGDLRNFISNPSNFSNNHILHNTIVQIFISLAFFTHYENKVHYDTHDGNFLYHKIKKGGFFHYNIYGFDFYLENFGILWLLWDFGRATDNFHNFNINHDFQYIIEILKYKSKYISSSFFDNFIDIYNSLKSSINKFKYKFTLNHSINNNFKLYVLHFLNLFANLNFIKTSLPPNTYLINTKPFII